MSCAVEPSKKEERFQRWDLGARIVIVKYVDCIAGQLLHFQHFCVFTMVTPFVALSPWLPSIIMCIAVTMATIYNHV